MGIYVLDGLNGVIDIVNDYASNIWTVQFYDMNDFQIVVPVGKNTLVDFQIGRLLVREEDVTSNGYKNVMIVESLQMDYDVDKGWMLTASGRGLKSLLARRIVWGQATLSGKVETSIRTIITDNVISPSLSNRTISDFILGASNNFPEEADIQLFGENIAEWLGSVCKEYGYGWDVEIVNSKYVFKLYKGKDRSYNQSTVPPVVFSPDFDNLLTSQYKLNRADYKNAALVGGEGEGTSKTTVSVGGAQGLSRYEAYIDGSSVSSNGEIITIDTYKELLKTYGREQLTHTSYEANFSGSIDPHGMYEINNDYFLGDIIEVDNGIGITATARISEIIYAEDTNGTTVVPTFTEWEV